MDVEGQRFDIRGQSAFCEAARVFFCLCCDKRRIRGMNQDLKDLKYTIIEISSLDIPDSDVARMKQRQLREVIEPVMRDFSTKSS